MAHPALDLAPAPRATGEQLRHDRDKLLQLAHQHGLSHVRLADAAPATLVVHVDDDPTNKPVVRFITDAAAVLGAEPHVLTDDAPAARTLTSARPL